MSVKNTFRISVIYLNIVVSMFSLCQLIIGSNLTEGSLCWDFFHKRQGYCVRVNHCVYAKVRDARIYTCSHQNNVHIICCPLANEIKEDINERISKKFNNNVLTSWTLQKHSKQQNTCTTETFTTNNGNTVQNEFIHNVAIGWIETNKNQINWNCGGVLINEYFILTAAHCMGTKLHFPDVVRVDVENINRFELKEHYYKIQTIYIHTKYKSFEHYHDIALIELLLPVTFTMYIQPAYLWQYSDINASASFIVATFRNNERNNIKDSSIAKTYMQMKSIETCKQTYSIGRHLPYGLDAQQHICVTPFINGKDVCQGNSGSPLYIQLSKFNCRKFLIGITSFGKSCSLPRTPSVYTKIFPYLDWINSIAFKMKII